MPFPGPFYFSFDSIVVERMISRGLLRRPLRLTTSRKPQPSLYKLLYTSAPQVSGLTASKGRSFSKLCIDIGLSRSSVDPPLSLHLPFIGHLAPIAAHRVAGTSVSARIAPRPTCPTLSPEEHRPLRPLRTQTPTDCRPPSLQRYASDCIVHSSHLSTQTLC